MWVLYCRVAGLEPFTAESPVKKLLQEFCQILVDYIASSHFGLYERIVEGRERRQGVRELAADLYPRIAETTTTAVAFNDDYTARKEFALDEKFAGALSRLGEHLATRIDLEDRLIDELLVSR